MFTIETHNVTFNTQFFKLYTRILLYSYKITISLHTCEKQFIIFFITFNLIGFVCTPTKIDFLKCSLTFNTFCHTEKIRANIYLLHHTKEKLNLLTSLFIIASHSNMTYSVDISCQPNSDKWQMMSLKQEGENHFSCIVSNFNSHTWSINQTGRTRRYICRTINIGPTSRPTMISSPIHIRASLHEPMSRASWPTGSKVNGALNKHNPLFCVSASHTARRKLTQTMAYNSRTVTYNGLVNLVSNDSNTLSADLCSWVAIIAFSRKCALFEIWTLCAV